MDQTEEFGRFGHFMGIKAGIWALTETLVIQLFHMQCIILPLHDLSAVLLIQPQCHASSFLF